MRSTPWPKLTLRTVMVSLMPVLLRAMTVPSNTWRRSLSPSLILTCTLMVSPGRNSGWVACLFLFRILAMVAFCIISSLLSQTFQQIRTLPLGFFPRCASTPLANLFVVAANQHCGHLPAAKLRGPGVMWPVEQPFLAERLVHGGAFIPQHSGFEASHRIHHHRGSQFAPAQYVIANRQLVLSQMVRNPLIHAFVAAADQDQFFQLAEFARLGLVKPLPLRRQQDHF